MKGKNMRNKMENIKNEFPIFSLEENRNLIYLDTAATSQKPKVVLDEIINFYEQYNANAGRSAHRLGEKTTQALNEARNKVAEFLSVEAEEIIFTKGSTEALNLVADTYGRENILKGDEILTTILEHHANFVPWQQLAKEKEAIFSVIDLNDDNTLDKKQLLEKIEYSGNIKILAITAASNVTGEIIDLKEIIRKAHEKNIKVVVDGTQLVSKEEVNLKDLDCDFFVFSGHKIFAPTGVGVLYGKRELLNNMKPYQYGGSMIEYVYKDKTEFNEIPYKFEAGTLNLAGIIGLKRAIEWIEEIGVKNIGEYEKELAEYTYMKLEEIDKLRIISPKDALSNIISFIFTDIHAHDVASILDSFNIAVRAGHHCAMPLHTSLGIPASTRISLSVYNTKEDIDMLAKKLIEVRRIMNV